VRKAIGSSAPITHFVCPAYFAKQSVDRQLMPSITGAIQPGDELALHLHGWRSLAAAAGIAPRLSPSFLTGTDQLIEFDDGDVGFDLDLDAYEVAELRALLRTSRALLEQTKLRVSHSFRAGAYLATPKVIEAISSEGYTVDSSAIDFRQLDELAEEVLPARLQGIWSTLDASRQPFPLGELVEMPIAAVADYTTAAEMVGAIESAHARLRQAPADDQFVVIAFHQETVSEFAERVAEAMRVVRSRNDIADDLFFTTIEAAAELTR
jgi:hypothetical protein